MPCLELLESPAEVCALCSSFNVQRRTPYMIFDFILFERRGCNSPGAVPRGDVNPSLLEFRTQYVHQLNSELQFHQTVFGDFIQVFIREGVTPCLTVFDDLRNVDLPGV